jgi:hypothetical protein
MRPDVFRGWAESLSCIVLPAPQGPILPPSASFIVCVVHILLLITSIKVILRMEGAHSYPHLEHSALTSDSELQSEGEWHPGDGICQTDSRFRSCFQSSFRSWSQAASTYRETSKSHELSLPPMVFNTNKSRKIVFARFSLMTISHDWVAVRPD